MEKNMSKNKKKTKKRKNHEAAPETKAFTPAEIAAEAAEAAAKAAETAEYALAELHGKYMEICNVVREAKINAMKAAKNAVSAANPGMTILDAAFLVLHHRFTGLDAKQMIQAITERGFWKNPMGLPAWDTLHAGIIREIRECGETARFAHGEKKGTFVANPELYGDD